MNSAAGTQALHSQNRHFQDRCSAKVVQQGDIGRIVSLGSQFLGPAPPSEMSTGASKYMPLVIIALAAVQLWYANNARKSGVLS